MVFVVIVYIMQTGISTRKILVSNTLEHTYRMREFTKVYVNYILLLTRRR